MSTIHVVLIFIYNTSIVLFWGSLQMDKEIYAVFSEMLLKQDETTREIKETNSILNEFMGVSVKQWEQQQKFNERFFEKLE